MTFDKATYTVIFQDGEYMNNESRNHYEDRVQATSTEHITLETEVNHEKNKLVVTVHGDGNVIPHWEEEFKKEIPLSASITCDVGPGAGNQEYRPPFEE